MQAHKNRHFKEKSYVTWTKEEKKLLWYCHGFSTSDVWPRGIRTKIFKQQIDESNLPKDKLKKTTINKIRSIISQIPRDICLDKNELLKLTETAQSDAQIAFGKFSEESVSRMKSGTWSREERWILLWTMEYELRIRRNKYKDLQKKRLWDELFYPRCPFKQSFQRNNRYTAKHNIMIANYFTEDEMELLIQQVENAINRGGIKPGDQLLPPPINNNYKTDQIV